MDTTVYKQIQDFIAKRELPPNQVVRHKIRRMAPNYTVKDNRLFYTGPNKKSMRLVIMSEEEKKSVLTECHQNPGTGNHNAVRGTKDRVNAGYYWSTIQQDVDEWVKRCQCCQLDDRVKKMAPELDPSEVKEPWEVLGMDLIGPLPETEQGNKYVLTLTDLFTKWVIAEPLVSKTIAEVSTVMIKILYSFGMVKQIITDQTKQYVKQLNDTIFTTLNIRHVIAGDYHSQTDQQDNRTDQNIKQALKKYIENKHNDWDAHLAAVVFGINTAKQYSNPHSAYFRLFNRCAHLPTVMNVCPNDDDFDVADPEEDIDRKVEAMTILNETVLQNIEKANDIHRKTVLRERRKLDKTQTSEEGDCDAKKRRISNTPSCQDRGTNTITTIAPEEVTVVMKEATHQKVNVSRLGSCKIHQNASVDNSLDNSHVTNGWQSDHPYANLGPKTEEGLKPLQPHVLGSVLDQSYPSQVLQVKEGNILLIREGFWSVGIPQAMDPAIGTACLKIVGEPAEIHGSSKTNRGFN